METAIQLRSGSGRERRYWTLEEKRRIVEETLAEGVSIAVVARRHSVNANQILQWRKLYRAGFLEPSSQQPQPDATRLGW